MRGSSVFALRLLRRHVGHRAQRRARAGQVLLVHCRSHVGSTGSLDDCAGATFARPKSRILAWPRSVTKMFAGLMSRWTMPLACAASSASAISMPSKEDSPVSSGRSGDQVLQRRAFQKLHRDERLAVLLADVVNGADVGMVQGRGGLRLTLEAVQGLRILGHFVGQELQRDKARSRVSSAL